MDDLICDGRFDARLVRENKSAKGIFITLEIAADDYFAAKLSDVRPGALLKIGYQEIVDVSVQPIEIGATPRPLVGSNEEASLANEPGNRGTAGISKPKKAFSDYPLSQQCAMTCEDAGFQEFLHDRAGLADVDVAQYVRSYCGVKSRSEIKPDTAAARRWRELEKAYEQYETDQRHAGSIRR